MQMSSDGLWMWGALTASLQLRVFADQDLSKATEVGIFKTLAFYLTDLETYFTTFFDCIVFIQTACREQYSTNLDSFRDFWKFKRNSI